MKKVILLIISCVLFSSSLAYSKGENSPACEKLNAATKDLISCHIEFAKATIDRKCEKLKKKIKESEEQLHHLETYSNQIDTENLNKRRTKLLEKIQKSEDRIYNLRLLKSSTEIVDFTDM
jgi:Xaa-Pro aminopeptidase